MNRLIIIGNGFDLAHGIKSSSKDLFLYYLQFVWGRLSGGYFNDKLVKIDISENFFKEYDLKYSNKDAISIFRKLESKDSSKTLGASLSIKSKLFKAISSASAAHIPSVFACHRRHLINA